MKGAFHENRCSQLVRIFQKEQSLTVSALAYKLDVSERTIRNDIKQLNQVLQPYASIKGVRGTYTLQIFDMVQFRTIIERLCHTNDVFNSIANRMAYIFERLLQSQTPVLMDELAYEMNIGRTTFVGDLKKLRTELEQYQISIMGKQNRGLMLCGQELDIRNYVLKQFYDTLYREYPLDTEIVQMVEQAFIKNHWGIDVQKSFLKFLTLMLDRYLQCHTIDTLSGQFYNLTARPEFTFVDTLLQQIETFLHVTFPIEERIFVFLPIVGMRTPSDIRAIQNISIDTAMYELLEKILQRIQLELNLTIESGEFTEEFLYHLMFMVNRLRFQVQLKNPILEELQKKYPLAYQMAHIAAKVIQQECHCVVSEEEKGYLAFYFSVFLEENKKNRKKPIQLAVVCGTGRVTARLVVAQLRKVLDDSVVLTVYSSDAVTSEILDTYDMIVSTVDLHCNCQKPVIRIYEIFHEQELIHKIEKARYRNQISVLDNNRFLMTSLLHPSRFFYFSEPCSYEQALTQMVKGLIASGQIDEGFGERLRNREKKGSMVFGTVAIPHTIQYKSDKLVLSIGVCAKPMHYHQHTVQIIFLLALPQQSEQEDLLIRVYDEIIQITTDTTMVEKIAAATEFQSLIQALYIESKRM